MTDLNKEMERGYTFKYLSECFDVKEGVLYWKERPLSHFYNERSWKIFKAKHTGNKAGRDNHGYLMTKVSGRYLLNHRIIYFLTYGTIGPVIDHVDGNSLNNLPENLRICSVSENMQNCKTNNRNTSGRKGVYKHKGVDKWTASIRQDNRLKHLGCFDTFEEAAAVRANAEMEHYGEFANAR